MSLPKEPRQKMINMMYLVLTALLALNVSNEVLEAFKTVDKSIVTSNESLKTKNDVIYGAFADELKGRTDKSQGPRSGHQRQNKLKSCLLTWMRISIA